MRNPFTPDFGRRPAHLVGCGPLLEGALGALSAGQGESEFTRLLMGPRGAGKTILLAEIAETAAYNGYFVVSTDAATPGLLDRIPACIAETSQENQAAAGMSTARRISGLTVGPVGVRWETVPESQPRWSLRRHLMALAMWARDHNTRAVLAVDELHAGDRIELRRLSADMQMVTKVRELPLAFVGAGLSEMAYTVLRDKKMTFFHRCHRDHTKTLDFDEAWRGLRLTVMDAGGSITPDALDAMARSVAGSLPYHLQSLGHHAWELAGAPDRQIDADVAEAAARRASQDMSERVVTPMWHDLPELDQDYMTALARCGGDCTRADIAQAAPPGISGRSLRQAQSRLEAAGHIVSGPGKRISLSGPLTAAVVREIADEEDDYQRSTLPAPVIGAKAPRCNAMMPRAQAQCVLARGHKGGCRSKV